MRTGALLAGFCVLTGTGAVPAIGQEPNTVNIRLTIRGESLAIFYVWRCAAAAAFVVKHAIVIDGGQTD
jgi:hypothetical protein